MAKKNTLILFLLFVVSLSMYAQTNSILYFTGYGRALIDNSMYDKKSAFMQNDTTSTKRKLDGNFVFDLGINIKPNEQLKANTILRLNNEFGGFYTSGSVLEFRQIQIQSILAKKIILDVGDLDLAQSRYTLYNPYEPTYSPFEADAFKIKRSIVNYDNFNTENFWRLQGMNATAKLNFSKVIRSVQFNTFGTRIKPSDFLKTQDRLLFGGSAKVKHKYIDLGVNYTGISDIKGTVQDTVIFYKNSIVTTEYKISIPSPTMIFNLSGELGKSAYNLTLTDDNINFNTSDVFFETGAGAKHKYIPISFQLSYRRVGPEFYSPGAQTRRTLDNITPSLLSQGMGGSSLRLQNIFDRMADLRLYNRVLSTTLMIFNPAYNNSTPYGVATPNRQGINLDFNYGNKDSLLYANINAQLLGEVIGTGIKEKRKFMVINPGFTFNINRLLNISRLIALSGAVRYEKTSGVDAAGVNLTSNMIDGSLAVETFSKLDIIGGIKYLTSKGKEYFFVRNGFNQITDYQELNFDFADNVYTFGLRYRLTNYIFVSANTFVIQTKYNNLSDSNYKINQYFFSFIMRF